jgi:1-acyl-sn-glycerol-3-phosphate acyltransferase
MIEAENHPIFTPLVQGYTQWSLRGHVGSVKLSIEAKDAEPTPTLFHATHVSWWDGYLGVCLAQHLGLNFRVAMLEAELNKYRFLRFTGGFGFTPAQTSSVREMLRYAKRELLAPEQASGSQASGRKPTGLFIFPSARIVPPNLRPIPYQPGTASLAIASAKDAKPVRVRAVSWRLEHRGQARPDAFIRVGPVRLVNGTESLRDLTQTLREDLTLEADRLQEDVTLEQLEAYTSALRGLPSAQEGWDAVRARLLPARSNA